MKRYLLLLMSVIVLTFYNLLAGNSETEETGYFTVTTGNIEDIKVTVFPNPLENNLINIESNKEFYSIEILDIIGKRIFMEEYNTPLTKKTIRLENLDMGLYLIRIKFENKKIYTEKIVIR